MEEEMMMYNEIDLTETYESCKLAQSYMDPNTYPS